MNLKLMKNFRVKQKTDRFNFFFFFIEITSTSNDIVFVGVAQLLMKQPLTKISIIDANKNEYITRHLVDGRIIYCDHRVSVVAGYLSEEVSGMSAFGFMHKDDRIWAMVALRQSKSKYFYLVIFIIFLYVLIIMHFIVIHDF